MAKGYRPYLPEQDFLLPPSLREWLPENHLAYFVGDVVDQLDLSQMHAVYCHELRGQPPYDPRMMTKLLLYGYCVGVFSGRKIQQRIAEDIAFRVLAAGNEPDFRTISDFRKIHLETLKGFVEELLARAEAADAEEDALYGKDKRGDELPEELQRRETRLKRIQEAMKAVEERAREKAQAEGIPDKAAMPEGKVQYNFTDPESRIMKSPEGFVQAYNAQAAVEPVLQLIVGQ